MLKIDKKRLAAVCLIFAILVFGVASWVAAQAEVPLIHACVSEPGSSNSSKNIMGLANTGSVRIVSGEADCHEGERYVFWNQQGVQGETGPVGPTGPTGEQGPPGQDGQSWYEAEISDRMAPMEIQPQEWMRLSIECLPGEIVRNGGWEVINDTGDDFLDAHIAASGSGFKCDLNENPPCVDTFGLVVINNSDLSGHVYISVRCVGPVGTSSLADTAEPVLEILAQGVGEPSELPPLP